MKLQIEIAEKGELNVIEVVEKAVENVEVVSVPSWKSGSDFDELFRQANDIQVACEDYYVSGVNKDNAHLDKHDARRLAYVPDHDKSSYRSAEMTDLAFSQLCGKIGVPVQYMNRCFNVGDENLVRTNVDKWLDRYGRNFLIREHAERIRAVLSSKYSIFDTPDILEVLDETIDLGDYSTKGYFLSPERFHLRLVQNEMLKIDGEDLFAGIQVDSSDVGRSTLLVRFMIFKQVCVNGLVVSKGDGVLFSQRHVGVGMQEFYNEFSNAMRRIPFLIEHSSELIEQARKRDKKYDFTTFSEEEFKAFESRIKAKTKLSDESVVKVVEVMRDKYSPTRWGLINSLTEVAQDFTLERRLEIEKVAGDMLLQVA